MYKGMEEESQVLHGQRAVTVTRPYIKLQQNSLSSESTKPCDFGVKFSSSQKIWSGRKSFLFFFFLAENVLKYHTLTWSTHWPPAPEAARKYNNRTLQQSCFCKMCSFSFWIHSWPEDHFLYLKWKKDFFFPPSPFILNSDRIIFTFNRPVTNKTSTLMWALFCLH